jgi:hypothetical protein
MVLSISDSWHMTVSDLGFTSGLGSIFQFKSAFTITDKFYSGSVSVISFGNNHQWDIGPKFQLSSNKLCINHKVLMMDYEKIIESALDRTPLIENLGFQFWASSHHVGGCLGPDVTTSFHPTDLGEIQDQFLRGSFFTAFKFLQ